MSMVNEYEYGEDGHTRMLTLGLWVIAKTWKHLKCPLREHGLNKLWFIHAREYYAAIKKNHLEPFGLIGNNLESKQNNVEQ